MSPVLAITGASSGIGAATARLVASHGWRLVLAARTGRALDSLAAELGCGLAARAVPCDVSDWDQVLKVPATAIVGRRRRDRRPPDRPATIPLATVARVASISAKDPTPPAAPGCPACRRSFRKPLPGAPAARGHATQVSQAVFRDFCGEWEIAPLPPEQPA